MTLLAPSTGPGDTRGPFGRALSVVWLVLFVVGLAFTLPPHTPVWVWIVSLAAASAWLARTLLPDRLATLKIVAEAGMIVLGGLVTAAAQVLGGVPLAVALILVIARLRRPVWMGVVAVLLAAASLGIGTLLAPRDHPNLLVLALGCGATVVVAVLVGVARRQRLIAARRSEQLLEAERHAERLDDHARVARDLHDVLAHGLGGLVVQLDAADALLESGRADEAAERIRSARQLARDGLVDARRAVDALRGDGDEPDVPAASFRASVRELTSAHRALGGRVDERIDVGAAAVPGPAATALRRALQEALVNARKHAPGQTVTVRVDRRDGTLRLTVENPLGRAGELAATGGGRGIDGMRERFARIAGGVVTAGAEGGTFRVAAEAAA